MRPCVEPDHADRLLGSRVVEEQELYGAGIARKTQKLTPSSTTLAPSGKVRPGETVTPQC